MTSLNREDHRLFESEGVNAMNKSELFKSRERRILAAALSTARSKGALDFRMADVARVAECSVGTLYGHFLSKEDMMAALVQLAVQRRTEWFELVQLMPISSAEKFIVLLLSDRRRLVQDDVLAQLEVLVNNTELWCRAADQRQIALRNTNRELSEVLQSVLKTAVEVGEVQLDVVEVERTAELGRALMLGVQLQASRQTLGPVKLLQDEAIMMDALLVLLEKAGLNAPVGNWHERCFEVLSQNQQQLEGLVLSEVGVA
ncbi:TetR/AcrR family transcriptional regulator [Ferrimonas lipolytica]|uniref:TetR/AcrR family transcriptional regulator n=1 Tax=Ferrimonas lipolytica TaxID=2724191 RepID=A0A6H1UIL8_9GAMM|nr:TetR/AcrR family transcriptional regulator [Ferrimonas lipolytica]QIZ78163.1 TetR/AcrR family transcriptional regulator [Ferrimonas lipolytica]